MLLDLIAHFEAVKAATAVNTRSVQTSKFRSFLQIFTSKEMNPNVTRAVLLVLQRKGHIASDTNLVDVAKQIHVSINYKEFSISRNLMTSSSFSSSAPLAASKSNNGRRIRAVG